MFILESRVEEIRYIVHFAWCTVKDCRMSWSTLQTDKKKTSRQMSKMGYTIPPICFLIPIKNKEHKQEAQCAQKGGGRLLVFVICGFIKNFYQILISYCKFIMLKALK